MSPMQLSHPARRRYEPIRDLAALQLHLQWATSLELSTIAPYLCALYSVQDQTSAAATLVRGVAIEEMLHMMLASNLMNSVGASPKLSGEFVAKYPTFLPHHAAGGPYVQLQALSPSLASTTFMPIEQPEVSPQAPPQGDYFQTIGQFYKAIELGFRHLAAEHGEKWLFGHDTGCQHGDTYFGGGGGHLVVVEDLQSALLALQEITEQGEGAAWPHPPLPGEDPFGSYEQYGIRLDGTYGPILGTPWEMSHYYKFKQLADGTVAAPAVYPMQANPDSDSLSGAIRKLSELCDASYGLLLRALEKALGTRREQADFFGIAFPVMQFVLPRLSALLMQTALLPEADPTLGPNAGPSFMPRNVPAAEVARQAEELLAAPPADRGDTYATLWVTTLGAVTPVLRHAAALARGHAALDAP
jgi:Ferritin-like